MDARINKRRDIFDGFETTGTLTGFALGVGLWALTTAKSDARGSDAHERLEGPADPLPGGGALAGVSLAGPTAPAPTVEDVAPAAPATGDGTADIGAEPFQTAAAEVSSGATTTSSPSEAVYLQRAVQARGSSSAPGSPTVTSFVIEQIHPVLPVPKIISSATQHLPLPSIAPMAMTSTSTGIMSTAGAGTAQMAAPSSAGPAPVSTQSTSTSGLAAASDPTTQALEANELNPIVLENMKAGNPKSEWGLPNGVGDANIQGFATETSVNHGQTIDFKIATDSTNYRIDIYRLGYYGGDGARKVDTIEMDLTSAQVQPHPIVDYSLGLIDCGNWSVSASWEVPPDAVSGVYFAKLVREDGTSGENIIPFVVRNDQAPSDITFQTSDTTWQAYNAWGGASLYYGEVPTNPEDMIAYMPPNCSCGLTAIGRAYAVSYNRPYITTSSPIGGPQDFIFGVESAAISWLEQNGYDVNYISGIDATRDGSQLLNSKIFLSVGHDEYWSAEQRANVEAARDAGVNLAFWSGNEVYWKVRWETSIDGSGTPYRTMVCYKETWAGTSIDPSSIGTGTWRDPRFADPGQEPENSLTGTMFTVDSYRLDTITIPYDYSNLRFWRNTDIAELDPGQTGSLVQNLLGYEWDSDVDNGFRPAGLINLSLSNVSVNTYLRDYGTTVGPADVSHSLTMYRAESGALVFGAGTVYWSWGLSDNHDLEPTPTDPNVQQAMVNLFADMGVQPQSLMASLVLATQSTDFTAPVSTITSPTIGASLVEGQRVTITGTASDGGGGLVAGIEVSTDGGETWHKANGRETWSYSWIAQASASYTIMSRAADDSLNLETPGAGRTITVTPDPTDSIWSLADAPANEIAAIDRNPVELGVSFTAATAGTITGIRFYKGFYNQGAHSAHLWTASGTLLATATFTNETLSGWQIVTFDTPVAITAGTTYLASYHSTGFYSSDVGYFTTPHTSGLLTATSGVFGYGPSGTFPGSSYEANYWVDVMFMPEANGVPVATDDDGFTTARNAPLAIEAATLLANDTDPNGEPLAITGVGNAVNGSVSFDAQTKRVIFTPTSNYSGAASFTYTVSDGRGGTASATVDLTVNPAGVGLSLFSSTDLPAAITVADTNPVELGVKFVAANNGTITGIRFYKGPDNTGPHTANLWTSTGTLLATASFTDETPSGWQTVTFANPVAVTAGLTYVASYHTNGFYSVDSGYFNTPHSNGPLTAPASGSSGGNGVFAYGSTSQFPTESYNGSNYWVDVLYNQGSGANQQPVANNDSGFTTNQNTPIVISAATLVANDSDPDGDLLTVTGVSNATNGTVSFDAQANTVTFTPTNGYAGPATFNYSVSDGRQGNATAQVALNVTAPPAGESLFSAGTPPGVIVANDPNSVELGMKFQSDVAGTITGIRYYKSADDTGPHVANLWTATGTLITSATFQNETASGWQTVSLAEPVAIEANTTYIVSYHSNGYYAATDNFFTNAVTNGSHLTAPASGASGGNGVYAYGSGSSFPTDTFNASNYWVDVIFNGQLAA
ncbi:DUF4082 domain-containing protein [Chelatococcus sp. GCM10030263]|uniref:DUF4082 domain-containing protein n=1 Tax=Chelatococcus sp. GCM10030263 TaxID=3273387 RepID=UPI0036171534